MRSGTLYTYPGNFRSPKIQIAARYSGFDLKLCDDFILGETNKSEEFLEKFPVGKVPALETADNKYIFESNAIAYYVGNENLRGRDLIEQTQILQWINFADSEILPAACSWLFPCYGIMQYNKQATERAKEDIQAAFNVLNKHLLTRTYLVGERITQADISVCSGLICLYRQVLEPSFRKPYTNLNRWFVTLVNQPEFKAVIGEVVLCEKMAQFDSKKFAELQKKSNEHQQKSATEKGAKPEKEKSKEEKQKPKEKKPKEKPKEEPEDEEMDETQLIIAAESKKDPFGEFPKGTFKMDDFKKVYSNEEESVSIKYFWDNFDAENYSIWYCEYLFPQELTLTFMSCNLIGGMFQRLDKMRKNAFASVCLFGEDNNSTISGIWVWRGHKLAFELSEDWQIDYESYKWTKLDPNEPETKKMVNEYLSWSGDFGGKKFCQGKIFK